MLRPCIMIEPAGRSEWMCRQSSAGPWWQALAVQLTATAEEIEAAFRRLARERHPDAGGSHDLMVDLNRGRAEGLKERGR